MTTEEQGIDEEIMAILESWCEGRESCKGCPRYEENFDFVGGCVGKICVGLILAARDGNFLKKS